MNRKIEFRGRSVYMFEEKIKKLLAFSASITTAFAEYINWYIDIYNNINAYIFTWVSAYFLSFEEQKLTRFHVYFYVYFV